MVEGDAAGERGRPPRFEVVLHGYNQRQVNERVTRLEFDLNNATKARGVALAQVKELSELLAAVRTERDQLADAQSSNSKLSERVQAMMQLANDEIADLRSAAEAQAKATTEQADQEAAQLLAAQRRRAAELEAEHYSLVAELRAETERTKAELYEKSSTEVEEHRARLERKYSEARAALKAEYDDLRAAHTQEHEQLMAQARTEAARIAEEAREEAEKTRREVIEEADRRIAMAEARIAELRTLHETLAKQFAAAHVAAQRAVDSLKQPFECTADTEHAPPNDGQAQLTPTPQADGGVRN